MEIDHGEQHLIERVAAIDIGKAEMVCCVRVPGAGRARAQEVRTYSTMTPSVLEMADWLTGLGVTRVVMEATSDYWKPVFYLLEEQVAETWLVNARVGLAPAGAAEDGPAGRGLVVQGRRTTDAAGQLRPPGADPSVA